MQNLGFKVQYYEFVRLRCEETLRQDCDLKLGIVNRVRSLRFWLQLEDMIKKLTHLKAFDFASVKVETRETH